MVAPFPPGGPVDMLSRILADGLQKKYSQVSMGSYPFEGGTSLVFRSNNYEDLEKSVQEMTELLESVKSDSIISLSKK